MEIQKLKIKDLKPAPYNPRKSSITQDENLKKSLEKFGLVEPIIVNKQTGNIVGGHFRVRELKKMGIKEVDCAMVDLSLEDEKELNIRLNANLGEWDYDLLKEWDTDLLSEWGLELPTTYGLEIGTDGFTLPDGDKAPFQQMTFTLADDQAIAIQNAIKDVHGMDEYKYMETFGNENSNGNALYLIVSQWDGQRK
jgi:hypothetical protein